MPSFIIKDINETTGKISMKSTDTVSVLICWFWLLYNGYVSKCPCFYEMHIKVLAGREASCLNLLSNGSEGKQVHIGRYRLIKHMWKNVNLWGAEWRINRNSLDYFSKFFYKNKIITQ